MLNQDKQLADNNKDTVLVSQIKTKAAVFTQTFSIED